MSCRGLLHHHNRQLNEACLVGRMINLLDRFLVIARLCPEDIRHERLRFLSYIGNELDCTYTVILCPDTNR